MLFFVFCFPGIFPVDVARLMTDLTALCLLSLLACVFVFVFDVCFELFFVYCCALLVLFVDWCLCFGFCFCVLEQAFQTPDSI